MVAMGLLQPLSLTRFRRNQYLPRVYGPEIAPLAFSSSSGEFGVSESLNQQIDRLKEIYKSELDPQGRAFVPLADAHRRLGDLGKALEVIQEGLGLHPDFASAHMVAGWVHRSRKEPDDAMRSFERVLALDVENTLARAAIAELIDDQRAQTYRDKVAARGSADSAAGATVEAERPVVPVASLAPAAPAETSAATDTAPDVGARPVVPISTLAPGAPGAPGMPDEDGAPVVPIPSLAPDVGDDVPNDLVQAGGEIYTETLAELYAGQDAIDEAIEVYQKLIANDPHNEALTRRLTELETLLLGSERQTVPIESLAPEGAAG